MGTLRVGSAGTGTLTNDGVVAPGTSPGTLTINGNYTQGVAGVLAVEIGGTTPGTQYDQLVVTGNTMLDGTLSVSLINAFTGTAGDTFTIIQSGGTVNGTFAATTFPAGSSFTTDYLASNVNLVSGGTNANVL